MILPALLSLPAFLAFRFRSAGHSTLLLDLVGERGRCRCEVAEVRSIEASHLLKLFLLLNRRSYHLV